MTDLRGMLMGKHFRSYTFYPLYPAVTHTHIARVLLPTDLKQAVSHFMRGYTLKISLGGYLCTQNIRATVWLTHYLSEIQTTINKARV